MATWTELKVWLMEKDWPWLDGVVPILVDAAEVEDGWMEELAFQELHRRPLIDKAVGALAEQAGGIPTLDPLDRCLLSLRLEFARGFIVALSAAETEGRLPELVRPLDAASREEKFRWVLMEAWDLFGRFQWEGIGYWLSDWRAAAEQRLVEGEQDAPPDSRHQRL